MIKDQVLSIGQMQHLKELGVDTSKASMYWSLLSASNHKTKLCIVGIHGNLEASEKYRHSIGTFTLQDILEMLPKVIEYKDDYYKLCIESVGNSWVIYYYSPDLRETPEIKDPNLLLATYNMLCWLAENKLL